MQLIKLPHKVCDYTCMVNGLEDLYEWKTGHRLPDHLFFYLSGMCSFSYIKQKMAPAPRMVFWNSNPKSQYDTLSDIVGFKWNIIEGRSFKYTLNKAKEYIKNEVPVIIGALDMYYLHYFQKFYHKIHVPLHYVMIVGFDDAEQKIYIHDCGKEELQTVSYSDLEKAWNVNFSGLCKPYSLFNFEFNEKISSIEDIVIKGLYKKADFMLNPPVSMLGIKAMRKLTVEFPLWKDEMDNEQYKKSLYHFAEYTGNPPGLPAGLLNYPIDKYNNHLAGRDEFAALLLKAANLYSYPSWNKAAELLNESGSSIEKLTDHVVDYIHNDLKSTAPITSLLSSIADLEEEAYKLIIKSITERKL